MKIMKIRFLLAVLLCLMVLIPDTSWGQRRYRYKCPSFDLQRHQVGFGVGSTLLDNVGSFNQYLNSAGGYGGRKFILQTMQSSLFSLQFDYQYRFDDRWSIETGLKYKHRHTIQTVSFVDDADYLGLCGSLNSVYHDFAIPVTANYRWVTRAGSSIEVFAGAGLTTLGLSVLPPATIGFSDMEATRAQIGIEYNRSLDVYGILGFQFEFPYYLCILKPFVSLSYSPVDNARYYVEPLAPTTMISGRENSAYMHLCELECGLRIQF